MITENDKIQIIQLSKKYGAKCTMLFGSSVGYDAQVSDIDLAVEGVAAASYFRFYGELMEALSLPIDLVDLGRKSRFTDLIRQEGVVLYG